MKLATKRHLACVGILAAFTVAEYAAAQPLAKEGRYDFTACLSAVASPVAFSKTHFGFSYEATGTLRSNLPGGIMDNATFRCVGLNTSLGGKNSQNTLCEAVDHDGDKQLAYLVLGSDGKVTREVLAGTGKFEGMQMNGILVPLGSYPIIKPGTFQNCNHQTGTYKLK